ncbi:hypothetical protein D3C84_628810 [compost metagenome]
MMLSLTKRCCASSGRSQNTIALPSGNFCNQSLRAVTSVLSMNRSSFLAVATMCSSKACSSGVGELEVSKALACCITQRGLEKRSSIQVI